MKRFFLLLCLAVQACVGQMLSPADHVTLDYAVESISAAKNIAIVFEDKREGQPAIVTEFSDQEWQLRFAAVLKGSELKLRFLHVFGINLPLMYVKERNVAIDFPSRGAFQIEISNPGQPLKQLDLLMEAHDWDQLQDMIMKRRANQALVPTPASVTPAAGAPVAPDAGAAHL